jgi:hypothetical protein
MRMAVDRICPGKERQVKHCERELHVGEGSLQEGIELVTADERNIGK